MNQSYRSDLTDEQWQVLQTLIPPAQRVRADRRLRRLEAEGFALAVDLEQLI